MEQILNQQTPPSPVVNPSPISPAPKKNLSLILIVILLILLAVFAGIVLGKYLSQPKTLPPPKTETPPTITVTTTKSFPTSPPIATPTTDPTADWKVYISPDGIYSFKYPNDWEIYESTQPLGKSVTLQCGKCLTEETVDLFQILPVIYKSIDDYINKSTSKTDYLKIKLNDINAVKAVIPGGPQAGGSALEFFVVYNNQGYYLSYRFRNLFDKNKLDQFPNPNPDILSTFKFLP